MGISRNSINITGITSEDKLPEKINGEIIQYSEAEHIYTPEDKPRIHTIHQISFKLETKIGRTINSPAGKIIVVDGVKKIKLIYTHRSDSNKGVVLDIQLPYNTFIDLPKDAGEVNAINVHVLDAYFQPIESRKIYSHIVYMLHVEYTSANSSKDSENYSSPIDLEVDFDT